MSAQLGWARVRDDSAMSHLMSAQRGNFHLPGHLRTRLPVDLRTSTFTRIAHEYVDQDTRRSTKCWNVDRRQSEEGFDTADGVCDTVRGTAIDGVLLAGKDGGQRTQRTSN